MLQLFQIWKLQRENGLRNDHNEKISYCVSMYIFNELQGPLQLGALNEKCMKLNLIQLVPLVERQKLMDRWTDGPDVWQNHSWRAPAGIERTREREGSTVTVYKLSQYWLWNTIHSAIFCVNTSFNNGLALKRWQPSSELMAPFCIRMCHLDLDWIAFVKQRTFS